MLRHRNPIPSKWPLARRRPVRLVEDEEPEDWAIEGPGEDKAQNANAPACA
jgi:hypothetical protein